MKLNGKYSLSKSLVTTLVVVAIVGSFGVGISTGKYLEKKSVPGYMPALQTNALDMAPFWKTVQILNEKFVATTASSSVPTDSGKVYGAIQGLTETYGDPYTMFFPPKESKSFGDEVRGDFGGIGLEIGVKDGVLTAVAPLKNTPAERAGIKSGDIILKIDKKFTAGMTVEDAISLIRGPKGTTVTLTIKKENGDTKDVPIERATIAIPTIDTKIRDDGVFVISLYNFSANSPELFRGALREFILSGSDKLVLDLRNNPGGYLDAAIDMASYFLPAGKTIVIEDSGTKAKQKIHRSIGYNIFNNNLKMVILINGGSASASEILAGALSEQGIAKLVGEKSYGKGSVQELIEITPDTSLKVTIARWLTPQGHSISQNGLIPDTVVKFTKDDIKKKYDTQLEKASAILLDPNFKK
jgi:carboxyl-terminal processing protease